MRWKLFALFGSKNNYVRSIIQTAIACSLFEKVCSLTGRSTLLCEHKELGKSVVIGTHCILTIASRLEVPHTLSF